LTFTGPNGPIYSAYFKHFVYFLPSLFHILYSFLFYKMFEIRRINWPIGPRIPERITRLAARATCDDNGATAPEAHGSFE
jgi:hypothetical protein